MIDEIPNGKLASAALHYRMVLILLFQMGLITVSYLTAVAFRLDMGIGPVSTDALLLALPILLAVRMSTLHSHPVRVGTLVTIGG